MHGLSRDGLQFQAFDGLKRRLSAPPEPLLLEAELADGRGAGDRLAGEDQKDGGGVFDGALETVPVRRGDALQGGGRGVAEVEEDQSESAVVQDEVRGLQCGFQAVAALHPEQLSEIGAGFAGGGWVEGIVAIDEGGDFATFCCGCEQGVGQGGASSGGLAEDFGDGSAREGAEGFGAGFGSGLEGGKVPCQREYFRHLFAYVIVARWGGSVKGEMVRDLLALKDFVFLKCLRHCCHFVDVGAVLLIEADGPH